MDGFARELRREPTEPEKRLWAKLSRSQLGYQVVRFSNHDVMTNIEGVCERLLAILDGAPDRWHSPHPNPSPEGKGLSEEAHS
ncbi:DUF559 domain-containing protein [Sphingobium sp. TomTYG75]